MVELRGSVRVDENHFESICSYKLASCIDFPVSIKAEAGEHSDHVVACKDR
jgi:hypothetical protein